MSENNNEGKLLQRMRIQWEISRRESAKYFRSALIYGAIFTIIWSVIGKLIPSGNWMIAYNIVMILISIWLIFPLTFKFFRMRMDWGWLAAILTAIIWVAVVVGKRTFIFNVFY